MKNKDKKFSNSQILEENDKNMTEEKAKQASEILSDTNTEEGKLTEFLATIDQLKKMLAQL